MATDDAVPEYAVGYESVETEHPGVDLPVEGSFPDWLSGTFVRNGPGKFEAGGKPFEHWFDGLAMLRRFAFDDGGVTYANRFLRTEAYREAAAGRVDAAGFAATPDRGPLDRIRDALSIDPTDNANADVVRIDGRYVALTESPRAVEFDPDTLATLGRFEWTDDLPVGHTTPHFRRDRDGGVWGYLTTFFPRAAYRLFRVPPGTRRREPVATVPVDEPAYMHSFGLTPRYAVLVEQPYLVVPWRLLVGDEPFVRRYEWKPQRRTRFLVVDRASGELAAEPRVPPFFTFHVVNAFEDDGAVGLDCVAWDTPSVLNGTFLDRLRSPGGSGGGGELRRYRVPLDGRSPEYEVLADGVALPRCDGARETRRHRYVYAQDAAASGPPRGIVKVDADEGATRTWRDPDAYASEPVFVPRPDREDPSNPGAEDDGIVLVELLVPGEDRAAVAVLDAETMAELGRARTPDPIPFGFHGQFYRDGA